MSVASEITRLQTAKADMKTALQAKGVTVGTEKLDVYDDLITSISVGTDISDADAAVGDVLADKTFYSVEEPIKTGTMVDRGTVSTDISAKATEVTIAAGKHSGSGVVKIATAEQDKIIAANVKDGVTILGVAGTLKYTKVVRQLTASGTWTKPAGLVFIEVDCIGAGGGGASGSKQAANVLARAGGGGSGGSMAWSLLLASELSATEDYVVGAGGSGGASVSNNSTTIQAGSAGGDTYFSGNSFATSKVYAQGGNGGNNLGGGGATRGMQNQKPSTCMPGLVGANSSATGVDGASGSVQNTSVTYQTIYGGGAGGGINTSNAEAVGGSGALFYNKGGTLSDVNGGAVKTNGTSGVNYYMDRMPFVMGTEDTAYEDITIGYGTPGGGGGSSTAGNAGNGGAGGLYGGAGGGGGSARNDVGNSGAGGNGAAGVIILIEYIVA